jgi:hypothetical protein
MFEEPAVLLRPVVFFPLRIPPVLQLQFRGHSSLARRS